MCVCIYVCKYVCTYIDPYTNSRTPTHRFLNQASAGQRLVHAWFLKIDSVRIFSMCVCLRVCPPPRVLITSGVMWLDLDPIQLVK